MSSDEAKTATKKRGKRAAPNDSVDAAPAKRTKRTKTVKEEVSVDSVASDTGAATVVTKTTTTTEEEESDDAVTWDNLEEKTMAEDWREALAPEFKKPYFAKLKQFLNKEKGKQVFPPRKDVYSWSRLTPLKEVKVVIIGQDPYHDDGQAHGLAFSVLEPVKPPPSLKNIYKQLSSDIPGFTTPKSGDLTATARQGVLWLNTSLTVEAHKAGSHSKQGWVNLTQAALHAVAARPGEGVVILAWGAHAQKMTEGIDASRNLVLKSAHPSPLSASRGFLGNEHFKKANEWLRETHGPDGGVDWTVLK